MTYEEAKNYIWENNCAVSCPHAETPHTPRSMLCRDCLCTVAIKALEMQIPKKPKIKVFEDEDEETHKKYKWEFYVCPVCGENIALKSYTHCHCGQAIDWSDEER